MIWAHILWRIAEDHKPASRPLFIRQRIDDDACRPDEFDKSLPRQNTAMTPKTTVCGARPNSSRRTGLTAPLSNSAISNAVWMALTFAGSGKIVFRSRARRK
jgi:hypothetical protein